MGKRVRRNMTRPLVLPESAVALRVVWRALAVPHPYDGARHLLDGSRKPGPKLVVETLDWMVSKVIDEGYLPHADAEKQRGTAELLRDAIAHAIAHWDWVAGQSRLISATVPAELAMRYLRLVALDICVRTVAFECWLRPPMCPPPLAKQDDPPGWSDRRLRDAIRRLPEALGLKRTALSPKKRFDEIFDGRSRPSPERLREFANHLAASEKSRNAPVAWQVHLLWRFVADSVCKQLALVFEPSVVGELAVRFWDARKSLRSVIENMGASDQSELVVRGTRAPTIERVISTIGARKIESLLASPTDVNETPHPSATENLEHDLRCCQGNWVFVAHMPALAAPISAEGIPVELMLKIIDSIRSHDISDMARLCSLDRAALIWGARLVVQRAFLSGSFDGALAAARVFGDALHTDEMLVESAMIHAAAGEFMTARSLIRSSSAVAMPAFRPLVAIIDALAGQHREALLQLDEIRDRDNTLEYACGIALRGIGEIEKALDTFEAILQRAPGSALVLEQAATCCFQLASMQSGKTAATLSVKGNRYAKEAMRLGRPDRRRRRKR